MIIIIIIITINIETFLARLGRVNQLLIPERRPLTDRLQFGAGLEPGAARRRHDRRVPGSHGSRSTAKEIKLMRVNRVQTKISIT